MGTHHTVRQVATPKGVGECLVLPPFPRLLPWRDVQGLHSKSPADSILWTCFSLQLPSFTTPKTRAEPGSLHFSPKTAVSNILFSHSRNQTLILPHHVGVGKRNCSPSAKLMQMPTLIWKQPYLWEAELLSYKLLLSPQGKQNHHL